MGYLDYADMNLYPVQELHERNILRFLGISPRECGFRLHYMVDPSSDFQVYQIGAFRERDEITRPTAFLGPLGMVEHGGFTYHIFLLPS